MNASEKAAAWVAGLEWEHIPANVIESVKLQVFDVIGVMLAARENPLVTNVSKAILQNDASTGGAVLGQTEQTSLANAALINGVMSAVLEFDDTHTQSSIHPTGASSVATIPAAQQMGASGRELLSAVLVGNELCCRLGIVSKVRYFNLAIQPTGVFGVFGATYALAKLRKLPVRTIVNAIGISGSMTSARMSSWEDGADAKTVHVGWVASHAVRAVAMAEQGVTGPAGIYDGRFNLFRSIEQAPDAKIEFNVLTDELGSHWEMLNIASKAYPSGYTIHPYLDAVFHLQKEHALVPDDIEEIRCHMAAVRVATICEPLAEKLRPATPWQARISVQHAVAEALVTGRSDKTAYTPDLLRDPVINSLADRVRYVVDPVESADTTRSRAYVEMTLKDGRIIGHTIEDMRGTRRNPMTRADFITKFRSNTHDILPADVLDQTIEDLLNLENIPDVKPIFDRIAAAAVRINR